MRRIIAIILAVYLFLSFFLSLAYNLFPAYAWDMASHRNGLTIVSIDHDGVWVLNPFSNCADDWM